MHRHAAIVLAPILLFSLGCGQRTGQVKGTITFKGDPVTAGSVLFVPKTPADQLEAGKPAVGAPDENGEFRLSTFAADDGALVGTHIVTYMAPTLPVTVDAELKARRMKLYEKFGNCKLPPGYEVEIKPGMNRITLELTK